MLPHIEKRTRKINFNNGHQHRKFSRYLLEANLGQLSYTYPEKHCALPIEDRHSSRQARCHIMHMLKAKIKQHSLILKQKNNICTEGEKLGADCVGSFSLGKEISQAQAQCYSAKWGLKHCRSMNRVFLKRKSDLNPLLFFCK